MIEINAEQEQNSPSPPAQASELKARERLIFLLEPVLQAAQYRIVHLEWQLHRQKVLRIFIDHQRRKAITEAATETLSDAQPACDLSISQPSEGENVSAADVDAPLGLTKNIGIQDCVKATHLLNEILDTLPELQPLLPENYELEVSSPGLARPLRLLEDYEDFKERYVRLQIFRPLTEEECENGDYVRIYPRQKKFLGTLRGVTRGKVILTFSPHEGDVFGKKKKTTPSGTRALSSRQSRSHKPVGSNTNSEEEMSVLIPLPLISKAHLEPDFSFVEGDERESKA